MPEKHLGQSHLSQSMGSNDRAIRMPNYETPGRARVVDCLYIFVCVYVYLQIFECIDVYIYIYTHPS